MKFVLVTLAVLAAAGPLNAKVEIPNLGKGDLHKDLQEFLDLLPVDKIVEVTVKYLSEDAEFQKMIEYMHSEEFRSLAKEVESIPEVVQLMKYIQNAGVDIYYLVNKLNNYIGIPEIKPMMAYEATEFGSGGLRGYVDEVKALLPMKKLQDLYDSKLKSSTAFKNFIDQIESPEFQKIVNTVYANQNFQSLLAKAKAAGVDVALIKELLFTIFGIKVPTKPIF